MFSVVIPVYNHAAYVAAAVLSALGSPLVAEVLLVDDGSRDGSRELIARIAASSGGRVRDLTDPAEGNRGAHARLNQLVEAARGPWIAVLNSDDLFLPGRFETIALKVRRSAVEFVCGHLVIIDGDGRPFGTKRGLLQSEYPTPEPVTRILLERAQLGDLLANQNFIATTSNMAFTKDLYARVGGFADYRYCHDWDFALRACALGRSLLIPQLLTAYRVHGSNTIAQTIDPARPEVERIFRTFMADFPAYARRPRFRRWMAGNRYLAGTDLVEAA